MNIIVTEIELPGCNHLCYHKFDLPRAFEGSQQKKQVVSYNSFFNGMKRRNKRKTKLFYGQHEEEHIHPLTEGVPIKVHANIWDFYTAIGYNFKKNKYSK